MNKTYIEGVFFNEIIERTENVEKNIAFSDGEDIRLIRALDHFMKVNKSKFILIGNENVIYNNLKEVGIKNIDNIEVQDPKKSKKIDLIKQVIKDSYKNRNKDLSIEQLTAYSNNHSYWAAVLLKIKEVDCAVGGSISTTAELIRAVINVLGLLPNKKYLSGAAFVEVPNCNYGLNGSFCLSDPAIIPNPSEEQLYDMTLSSYNTAKSVFSKEPVIAMLSYSTKGSADGESVEKIRRVVNKIRDNNPEIKIDGELQFDAAIVPDVAKIKVPDSRVAGNANVLIFPELNSANIGYKIIQRLAKAEVCGTIVQGAARPFNDLSRGCLEKDIITLTAMTILQSDGQEYK